MIINKTNKAVQTRSDMPDSNWLGDEWYLVPDDSAIARKVQLLFPRYDFVLDENGELIDIVEVPKTEEELNQERIEEIKTELARLDNVIKRDTEQVYSDIGITPSYQPMVDTINKKEELRKELQNLTKVGE